MFNNFRFKPGEKVTTYDGFFKECCKCRKEKNIEEFRKQKTGKWGRKGYCIECDNAYQKERYQKKSYALITQAKQWNNRNPEKTREYKKNWQRKHRKGAAQPLTRKDLE